MKSTTNILGKYWCWSWSSSTLVTWCEDPTHWNGLWCWERLKAGGEGDDRGWEGWMASPTQWTWVWACSGSWWWKRRLVCCSPSGLKELDRTSCSFLFYELFVYINGRFSLCFSYGLFSCFLCMRSSHSIVIKTLCHWQMLHFLYACSGTPLIISQRKLQFKCWHI